MDWIAGLPTTPAGFDMIQNHADLLSAKVHAVPTRSTATATDAANILRDMCLRSCDGFPDVLAVDHHVRFTGVVFLAFVKSTVDHHVRFTGVVFLAFVKSMGSSLIVNTRILHIALVLNVM